MRTDPKLMIIESVIHFENDREDIVVDTWNVYTSNHIFKEIFKKNESDFNTYAKKKKVIKNKDLSH